MAKAKITKSKKSSAKASTSKHKCYDVAIIGGGIIGGVIAWELAHYNLNTIVFEKMPTLASQTSTGNTGVLHGGFDAASEKMEAKMNVEGVKMWVKDVFPHLTFPRLKVPSLICAFNDLECQQVDVLYKRGLTNGVLKADMQILDAAAVLKREPHINPQIKKALLCTSSWAIHPVYATHCFFGVADQNGTEIKRSSAVTSISKEGECFKITINNSDFYYAKNIINVAGHYADVIAAMAGYPDFKQGNVRRGEYCILSEKSAGIVNEIVFKVPTIYGKGVVVAPMLDGRVIVGPTAENNIKKEDARQITQGMWNKISEIGKSLIPTLPMENTMLRIAGSRPLCTSPVSEDFFIQPAKKDKNFIHVGGMSSPAIAAAPAISALVAKFLKANGTKLTPRKGFKPNYKVIW